MIKHRYPSKYPPGQGVWFIDAAWEILDFLPPGAVSDEHRALLAGMIGGRLSRERDRAAKIAQFYSSRQIAEAIRRGE